MCEPGRKVAITFNGEIYNFKTLRQQLAARGHVFQTHSDTEVILKIYLEYGTDCPQFLEGMFAFAIWDDEQQLLFMARDRFGKKPLYFAHDAHGRLIFGSEVKALLASGLVEGRLDQGAIDDYLRLGYVPPTRSAYEDIETVNAAQSITVAGGVLRRATYWRLERRTLKLGYSEAKEQVRGLLTSAVRKRMVADVEVGALLSGGVDSTIVSAYAQGCMQRPLKTFSVGYGDYINELPFSQAAADAFGTEHHTLQVGGPQLVDDLLNVTRYLDEPHADTSNVSQFLVSRLARSLVKVALCGDGGDEVFLGYEWYWRHHGSGLSYRLRQALRGGPFRDYLDSIQYFGDDARRVLWGGRLPGRSVFAECYPVRARWGGIARINAFDLDMYLPGQLLTKADRIGMMNSLEVRSPFLDHRLAEFVVNLPQHYKIDNTRGKLVLKDLLAELMPAAFVHRKKQGFGAPVRDWLKTICRPLVHDALMRPGAHIYSLLERKPVVRIVDRFYRTADTSDYIRLWILLSLELWLCTHSRVPTNVEAISVSQISDVS